MDDLIFRITKNQLFGVTSILAIAGFTYLAKRYLSNIEKSTNKYYTKPNEIITTPNLNILKPSVDNNYNESSKHIFIFWNGDDSSTYLLIDLLQQDYIIQPLYIERFTIIKQLEGSKLEALARQYKDKPASNQYKFLQDIAKIKKNQTNELTQLDIKRSMILNKFNQFQHNLLPTIYITTIAKDMDFTSSFFIALKEHQPMYYDGIEFLEQVIRFLKNYTSSRGKRIILGYNTDSKNMVLIREMLKKIQQGIIDNNDIKSIKIDIPLENVSSSELKFRNQLN
jgi:hypothetical protein